VTMGGNFLLPDTGAHFTKTALRGYIKE
jgi:hypothetical protein